MIDYSVIIRTTGKAGEKYQRLLDAIAALEPKPREVIVVLPEGYALPQEQLGWETFIFSPKGMVIQRVTGIEKCQTRYALICDDDVCFGSDFVQQLYQPVAQGLCGFSSGPLYSFLPNPGKQTLLSAIAGSAAPTLFHKDRYTSVLRTSGYSYNRHLNTKETGYYKAQSLAWTCFFADLNAFEKIDFAAESWLDAHGYSAMDDQTMFYKAWLRGIETIVVSTAFYEHLDGKTSVRNNKPNVLFSLSFNRVIFWHRFLYTQQPNILLKVWALLCFGYRILWMYILSVLNLLRHHISKSDFLISIRGLREGFHFLRSKEYRAFPEVR